MSDQVAGGIDVDNEPIRAGEKVTGASASSSIRRLRGLFETIDEELRAAKSDEAGRRR